MISAMLDLETLGTGSHSAVISMGVAIFDDTQVTDTWGNAIRPEDWHGDIDPKTVSWWMQQDSGARCWSSAGYSSDVEVATRLGWLFTQHNPEEVWANDPSFDVVILRHWWQRVAIKHASKFPIDFRSERSFRTIKAECKRLGIDIDSAYGMNTTAHNPVDDAANQARAVILARSRIVMAPWDAR